MLFRIKWKRATALLSCLALVVGLAAAGTGCSLYQPSRSESEGALVGGATGAVAGALLDSWRGGVIGGVIGVVAGATLGHIMDRAARESAQHNKPVTYTSQNGAQRVQTQPVGRTGDCQIIKEKYYENGQLVRETERRVCN